MRVMSTPAEIIINKCGGPDATAALLGLHRISVLRWDYPKERGGSGGLIPTRHQNTLLRKARKKGIDISPSDFFPVGASQ